METNKPIRQQTIIHNNTQWSINQIKAFGYIGRTVNNWRKRNIALYNHPTDPAKVISIGRTFDGSMVVICEDPRSDWRTSLEYIAQGKVYTSE